MVIIGTSGTDYVSVASSVTFAIGSNNNSTQCLNITIIDDYAFGNNRTFTVTLFTIDPRIVLAENFMTVVTIVDDDGQYFQLSYNYYDNIIRGDFIHSNCGKYWRGKG